MERWELFKIAREKLGLTTQQVGDRFGISYQAVQQWETPGGTTPRGERLADLLRLYNLPLDAVGRSANITIDGPIPPSSGLIRVAAYANQPGAARGGDLRDDEREPDMELPPALFGGVTPKGPLVTARIEGDSMHPEIKDGERIIIDTGDIKIVSGKIYCFRTDDGPLVKRLRREMGRVKVISDAGPPLFPEYFLEGEPIMIGRVILTLKGH